MITRAEFVRRLKKLENDHQYYGRYMVSKVTSKTCKIVKFEGKWNDVLYLNIDNLYSVYKIFIRTGKMILNHEEYRMKPCKRRPARAILRKIRKMRQCCLIRFIRKMKLTMVKQCIK